VRLEFNTFVTEHTPRKPDTLVDFEAIIGDTPEAPVRLGNVRAYAARLGATLASAPRGHAFLNGRHLDMDDVSEPSEFAGAFYLAHLLFSYFCETCRWR
jgi:UDP-glucose:glycoprotein glucosyltransferase